MSLRKIEIDGPSFPLECSAAPPADLGENLDSLDDATLRYVLDMRPAFDLLRDAASQLAALLVLAASGGRSAQDNPMFALARSRHAEAMEQIRSVRPPRRGCHHHRHLAASAKQLAASFSSAALHLHRGHDPIIEEALAHLRGALQHLHWAAAALPGFEIVAMGQSCCAAHSVKAVEHRSNKIIEGENNNG